MKKKSFFLMSLLVFVSSFLLMNKPVYGKESSIDGTGSIGYTGELPKDPIDPENPPDKVDPGPSPSTDGALRFDFAPTLNFGSRKITKNERKFYAQAQLFHGDIPPRGNYIQITDSRADDSGWTLQVRQEYQFKNDIIQTKSEKELKGATLSFDKIWANSSFTQEKAPQISKETILIDSQGTTFPIAQANVGEGRGTWVISFGASEGNKSNQLNTLIPKVDDSNQPVTDKEFENQQIYENSAIFLSVPPATMIHPVQYQTELTWILAELP